MYKALLSLVSSYTARARCLPRRIAAVLASSVFATQSQQYASNTADIFGGDPEDYRDFTRDFKAALKSEMDSPNRFQPISKRELRSDLPLQAQKAQYRGKYLTLYKGYQHLKSPEDILIYQQMFWHLKPRAIIELGTFTGAAALWMGDCVNLYGIDCHVYSVDVDQSLIPEQIWKMKPENVTFLKGDCNSIQDTLSPKMLSELPRPLFLMEDSHVNVANNLSYFHNFLHVGDYILVDETSPEVPKDLGMGLYLKYDVLAGCAKHNEIKRFLSDHEDHYAIDSFFNDFFGYNFTTNWNSIIRKMK